MNTMARCTVLIHHDPEEQVYLVSIPALGTAADGATIDEAVSNARDAIEGGLPALAEYGRECPMRRMPHPDGMKMYRIRSLQERTELFSQQVPEEPSLPMVMSLEVDADVNRPWARRSGGPGT
jgi:predicted RNase H-like HicB family nuclease